MTTDLWQFSVTLYQRPGIEQICLQLQHQGMDVCVLLCALWLESLQITSTAERAYALTNLTQDWRAHVVVPLRQLRQQWRERAKSDPELATLREQVKQLELNAEREQLRRLAALCQSWLNDRAQTTQDWIGLLLPEAAASAAVQRLRHTATEPLH